MNLAAQFKESLIKYNPKSVDRNLSSLRKFFHFLKLEGLVSHSPFDFIAMAEEADPWRIKDFKSHLYVFNASGLTIKNYIIDLKQFVHWAEAVVPKSLDLEEKTIDKVNDKLIEEYKERLLKDLN